jgi:hypothetical protein
LERFAEHICAVTPQVSSTSSLSRKERAVLKQFELGTPLLTTGMEVR